MIRLGLMGCGAVADYGHVPAIKAMPEFILASIYDPSRERVEAIRDKFEVEGCFTDSAAFLASGIEAVVVTSPVTAHLTNVLDALHAGKHVLCEKPLASVPSEALRMITTARRRGLLLFTAFDYRFSS